MYHGQLNSDQIALLIVNRRTLRYVKRNTKTPSRELPQLVGMNEKTFDTERGHFPRILYESSL